MAPRESSDQGVLWKAKASCDLKFIKILTLGLQLTNFL